eukprot:8296981-Pyramimonas_sp.AAC.2
MNRRFEVHNREYHEEVGDAPHAGQPASSSRGGAVHPEGDEGAGRVVLAEAAGPAEAAPSESDPEPDSD